MKDQQKPNINNKFSQLTKSSQHDA